jgi:hypothetical protein
MQFHFTYVHFLKILDVHNLATAELTITKLALWKDRVFFEI